MDTQRIAQGFTVIASVLCLAGTVIGAPQKEYSCYARPADVFFLLDSSNSIWAPDFDTQLNFVKDVIDFFPIGDEFIHVGIITYSSFPQVQFNLDAYDNVDDIHKAIGYIKQQGGIYTHTDRALELMRDNFKENYGSRPGVIKVGIVITDGRSTDTDLTQMQAIYARAIGINLFAIGVGDRFDTTELRNIATPPNEDYMFLVDNFESLDKIKEVLAIKTCQVTEKPTTTTTTTPQPTIRFERSTKAAAVATRPTASPDKEAYLEGKDTVIFGPNGCKPRQPLDLAFIIDDKQGGTEYKREIWSLVRGVIDSLDYDNDDVRISFIRECAEVPEIKLSRYYDKATILDHLDNTRPVLERTPGLLRAATNKLSEHDNIWDDRHKVAVYITDGESRDLEGTLREAQFAKNENAVEIFGVGIGDEVNQVELNALVSCEPDEHLHHVGTHRELQDLNLTLARNICQATPS